jgi:hypothetical protein
MKRKTTFLAKAFLMLFAVLFSLTGARAQQALPYEYGFENNDLAAEGWTIVDGAGSTGIKEAAKQNGSYGFQFYYNTNPPQYLISPELTGTESGVTVAFSYKNPGSYTETFKVGYSTTTSDTDAFEWEAEITATSDWTLYENTFPAGTKYVAVAYTANDQFKMYLDDFSFTVNTGVAKPTGLKVSYDGGTEATVSWSSDASAFDIDLNDVVTEDVPNPYTLKGLSLGTTYTIKVRAKEGTDVSGWSAPVSFTTDFPVFSLPYEDGFEDGIAAWTLVDCTSGTGLSNTHNGGAKGFAFKYNSNPPQYLISPEFEGTSAMTVSFWYRIQNASYPETFQVGYSTTTKDVGEFTWGDEVTATNNNDWLQYEADFPNGTKYVAVRYNSNDMYYLFVDDFSFTVSTGVAKPTGLKVDNIGAKTADLSWAENGEATAWEICLNDDEVNLIPADSNPFTLTGLTPETDYTAKVRAVSGSAKSAWSNEVAFTTDVEFPAPKDLAVVPAAKTAEVSWTGNADATSYNLRYREAPLGGTLTTDFEDSSLGEWTTIDADGDGFCWDLTTNLGNFSHHNESADCVTSGSYDPNAGALNPDNYLVSPQVLLGGSITFWACAQDASYAAEHFGVAVSTTSNTDPSAFTTIQEWTMTSAGTPSSRRKAAGTWGEYTVDLSAYAGQTGYVAIRHFNCSDFFYLNIDDITIEQPAGTEEPWTTVTGATSPYTIEGLTPETKYQVEVQGVYADGESKWAGTSFTTLEDVPTPSALAVSDVTWGTAQLSWTENGTATAWQICLDGNMNDFIAADSNPFTLTGLTPETEYTAKVRAVNGEKTSKWSEEVTFTTDIRFHAPTDVVASNVTTNSAEISWTATDAAATSFELQYAEGNVFGSLLRYDDGTPATNIGNSSSDTWTWGVMYPGSMVNATQLAKVIIYEGGYNTEDITINIYQGGDSAPETLLYTETVTPVGGFHEVTLATPVAVTPGQNLWITLTETGTYVLVSCATTEPNNQWVYSGSWANIGDLASSLAGYGWMIRAEINDGIDPATVTWTSVADVTSPYELTGLNPETTYTASVKAVYGTEGESKWTSTTFKTLSENPVPANIVADLAADGATLTWEGKGDSYNVQYRTAEGVNPLFEDDFANSNLGDWTTVNLENGGGVMDGGIFAFKWTSNPPQYLVSPELTGIAAGNILTFNYRCYDANYPETFKVGYSTTTNDVENDFTWSTEVTAGSTSPQVYTLTLPADVKYISIQCTSDDMYYFIIDGISIYDVIPASAWQEMAVTDKTATISGLDNNNILYEYQVQSVKGGNTSAWSAIQDFALMTLDSDADNTSVINAFNGKQAHVTLANRTLYQDNTWNTICLPFDMTLAEVDASPLAGGDVRTLTDNITVENESVTLNFTAEGEALTTWGGNTFFGGVPYIVKWASGSGIVNPEFANVTITADKYYVGDNTKVKFEGTYAPIDFAAEEKSILFIGADNKFNYPLAGAKIGAMRGYFELIGYTAGEGNGVKIFTNLDDDDATGIANLNEVKDSSNWYDISGRKLAGKPSVKGIYVNGGRKVTIK